MALMVQYDEPRVTRDQYDAARKALDWEHRPPAGCMTHTAFFDETGFHTIDIWETQADLDAYLTDRFNAVVEKLGLPKAKPRAVELYVVAASPSIAKYFVDAPAVP